jgi:hypothetical protein
MATVYTQPSADRKSITAGTGKSPSEESNTKKVRSRMVSTLVKPRNEE